MSKPAFDRHIRSAAVLACAAALLCSACKGDTTASSDTNVGANALAVATATNADSAKAAPLKATCAEVSARENEDLERSAPVAIPAQLRHFVASGVAVLTVAPQGQGSPICIDIQWAEEIRDFALLTKDQRFLGFDEVGYESGGYVVIDRGGAPNEIDTGTRPIFSPSGRRFASAEYSESTFGNLNDIGVWEITESGTKRLFAVPEKQKDMFAYTGDWRAERWVGENCVVLSLVDDRQVSPAPQPEPRPRRYMQLKDGWKLSRTTAEQACTA